MGILKNLIDFLPYYYKEQDTYKKDAKGILERFLENLGGYLEETITTDIENTLDNFDIDNTKEYFLNYLWEFLGELPFGYTPYVDKEAWDKYYNGFDTEAQFRAKSRLWEIMKDNSIKVDPSLVRRFIQFSTRLTKIRGTKEYFDILFKFYGMTCTITDPVQSTYKDDFSGVCLNTGDFVIGSQVSKFDNDERMDDGNDYDLNTGKCPQCIKVNIDVSSSNISKAFAGSEGTLMAGSDDIILFGKKTPWDSVIEGLEAYNSGDTTDVNFSTFIAFRKVIENFFNKYLPYNVEVGTLTFQSISPTDSYGVEVLGYDTKDIKIVTDSIYKPVKVKVKTYNTWTTLQGINNRDGYRIGILDYLKNTYLWSTKVYYDDEVEFYNLGYFAICNAKSTVPDKQKDLVKLHIVQHRQEIKYNFYPVYTVGYDSNNRPNFDVLIDAKILTWYYERDYQWCSLTSYQESNLILKVETEDNPAIQVTKPDGDYTVIKKAEGETTAKYHIRGMAGTYRFSIVGKDIIFKDIFAPYKYLGTEIRFVSRYDDDGNPVYTDTLLLRGSVILSITSQVHPDIIPFLHIRCKETGVIYPNLATFKPTAPGTYTFEIVEDPDTDPETSELTVTDIPHNYVLDVKPTNSSTNPIYLQKDPETGLDIPVKVKVRCYNNAIEGLTDFRVYCLETREIILCDKTREFTFNLPGEYTLICLADTSITSKIYINQQQ